MDDGVAKPIVYDYVRHTTDAIPALISFFDADHVCRYANDHHLIWYGRAPEDLVGLHMSEFLGGEAYSTRIPYLERVKIGQSVSFEARVPHRQDGWRDAAIRYVPRMGVDGFEGFHTLVFDLSREQQRYHSVFDGTAVGFWEIDLSNLRTLIAELEATVPDLVRHLRTDLSVVRRGLNATPVLDLNEKACSMFGLARSTVIGRSLGDWVPDAGLDAWNRNLLAYLAGEESYETETVMRREDGALIDILLSCAFPKNPSEQVIVVVGLVDISERVGKEKALARAQADLAHAGRVAMLGELMASIAHEVNQPLAAIVANSNAARRWLARTEPDIVEAKAAIQRIMNEATRASEIITRTRRMAMKGSGTRTEFDVNAMIEETLDITRRQTAALGAQTSVALVRDLPLIVADRIQLQQVLINLIVNAAQAMANQPEGTRDIMVSSSCGEEGFHFEVSDTGPGLGADADRVFEAFFTTKSDGMGMGLSVAKSIIEAHAGTITAAPRPDRGVRFCITMPIGSRSVMAENGINAA
ncbi:PAS domain S-box-containing protein [Sphingobium sp. AP50]|uniref:PAS domain-containing sensor histidine kinase n=1 Tax=Sphingobium sp. AP50 TaxID=1884369 RepID=UPI0008C40075|nr:ATP-binding protein [Sphingobium sp. AP50]SEJ82061.1 PAS domain S-box-containing protein [Sphingobium sp. AP50]